MEQSGASVVAIVGQINYGKSSQENISKHSECMNMEVKKIWLMQQL